ncbi:hypothetical protein LMT13_27730, partial [Escherichia coli]
HHVESARRKHVCQCQGGWGARLDGRVNTCELLINIVNPERAKGTDRPDPKWERSWTFLF